MARQVLPIVGMVAGFFLPGGPAVWGAIGSAIGNYVDPQVIKGPRLGEAGVQTSAEGVYRPIVYGTAAVKGNIIDRGNRVVRKHRERQSKGGGPVTESERVYWTFAIRICEGPIGGILRVWEDEKLVYDVRPGSTMLAESAEFENRCRFYLGDEEQLPDPDLEAFHGAGNVPSYRGTAYAVFPNADLTDYRERIPDYRWEVTNTPASPYQYLALLHMDEKYHDTGTHIRDEVDPNRWSPGGDLITQTSPFGSKALEIYGLDDTPATNFDFAGAIGTEPFFISAIVYRDSSKPDAIADTVLGHWYAPGTRSFSMLINRNGDQNIYLQLSADGTNITTISASTPVPEDVPVEVAISRDESGVVRIFQQLGSTCELVGSGSFPFALHSNPIGALGENWRIGGHDQAPGSSCLFGWIKEVAIIVGSPIHTEAYPASVAPWPNPTDSEDIDGVALSAIVADLHTRAGHTEDRYDVSELTDSVTGLVLAESYTCADVVRTLTTPYFFDAAEYDSGTGYRVHYVKRGKPVVKTITVDDLIEAPSKTTRLDALELPRTIHFHYQSPLVGYVPAKATVTRDSPDVLVVGEASFQVPVAFSGVDEPRQIAHKYLKILTAEAAGEEEFVLGDNHLDLVPTDCIGLSIRGQVRRVRLGQEMAEDGCQSYKAIPDRQSAYTSSLAGIPLPTPTPPRPSIPGQTISELMDLPALNDSHDRLVWFEAATGQTEAWFGAQTQRKVAPSTEFEDSVRFTVNTIMGSLLDPITAASAHYSDRTNVVRVHLYTDDQIDALTMQQFLSEGGSFALKNDDGTWEILQYRDVVDEGEGTFALSYLARGRLNTGATAHSAGARFVLLDAVKSVDVPSAWIGADVDSRAVSLGTSPDGAIEVTTAWNAKSQTEFPVAHLFLNRAGDTIEATTVPRHRFGTELNPVRSVNWQGYLWTATDGANTAQQTTIADTATFDATGWASPITVTVAQVNRFTGPGPSVSEQIE